MRIVLILGAFALALPALAAEPVVLPKLAPEKLGDPKEAAAALELVEKHFAGKKPPEAAQMLTAILKGSQLNGTDGWFGPAQSRYSWQWLAERHKLDAKAKALPKDKFEGGAKLFDALDRNGDGAITASDLDWSPNNPFVMQSGVFNGMFRRFDATGDGRITREELDAVFKGLSVGKEHFTADDLRRVLIYRGPGGFGPGDGPSVPTLVKGLYAGEIGSIQEGPALNDDAPDFELKLADGSGTVKLSKETGKRPVVLVFGNFTCGPFRSLYPDVEAVFERYKDRATFLMVYVREAHPTDGWKIDSNARFGVAVKQPTTNEERTEVCAQFRKKLNPAVPIVVDEISDPVGNAYSGMPARLYVLDTKGKVAYKSGRGPFGFKPGEMEQALAFALLEASAAK
jgi:Ca2+-binding EF-hand superfamily protein/thiol-disulfide isomerase/thioredoxin